eukprot:TRINITY_DN10350_c0_g1_i1.p1 TRINITY_DN10350_c0_g1~~TRINITY_DN10350_c0_g1_i1.p1  ORF type:complete len:487 (-),score=92.94 TRINITY_DN10350_c0_g1_i1:58-1518(-)
MKGRFELDLSSSDVNNDPTCCFPIPIEKTTNSTKRLDITNDGKICEIAVDGSCKKLEPKKINLHDCLSCGGCPNAEETILKVPKLANWELLREKLNSEQRQSVVVSLSAQSRCSLASYYRITQEDLVSKLTTILKDRHTKYLFDISFARELSLLASAQEFLERKHNNDTLPIMSGSCPGWVTYAETSQHNKYILPYISVVKSPQQVMGSLVKYHFSKKISKPVSDIFHITIMPCSDRQRESNRPEFLNKEENCKEVDMVLTTTEFLQYLNSEYPNFESTTPSTIDPMFVNMNNEGKFFSSGGGPSDGYLEYVFKHAARSMYSVNDPEINYKYVGKTKDFKELSLIVDGKEVLKFAAVYGFRNILTVLKQIKTNTSPYHYIEVMACPSGCTNGGGQIEAPSENPEEVLQRVNNLYYSQPVDFNSQAKQLYDEILESEKSLGGTDNHTPRILHIEPSSFVERSSSSSSSTSSTQEKKGCKCSKEITKW